MSGDPRPREWGEPGGPSVLMLHSLFCDGTMFDRLLAELPQPVRAYCPDFRGQGASDAAGAELGVDALADDVTTLLRETIAEPVHLVGSSMGAYVGVRVAARAPELVASCTLLCCTARAEPEPERFAALCDALAAGPREAAEAVEHTMFGETFLTRPRSDPERARWRRHFEELPPRVADAARAVFARRDMRAELGRLPGPALLVAGGEDRAKRPADMAEIADLVPGSRVVVLERAGHTPAIETPRELAGHLARWWGMTAAPPGARNAAPPGARNAAPPGARHETRGTT